VPEVKFRDIVSRVESESSEAIKERVCGARRIQLGRFRGTKIFANAQMGPKEVKAFCRIDREGEKLLEMAVTRLGFSARAYDRSLKDRGGFGRRGKHPPSPPVRGHPVPDDGQVLLNVSYLIDYPPVQKF
jgi:hypothetical protein